MPTVIEYSQFALAFGLLLLAAHVVGHLFEVWRLPRVIGEIVGGLLLGPTLASNLWPGPWNALLTNSNSADWLLPTFSQVGLILLMYASGLQLRSFAQPSECRIVAILAVVGILIPFLAGIVTVQFVDTTPLIGPANNQLALVLVFGTAIAIASIPVISRIMIDLGIMETPFARIVVATAVIDDLVLYIVLAVALSLVAQPNAASPEGIAALLSLDSGSSWATAAHVLSTLLLIASVLLISPAVLTLTLRLRAPALHWDGAAGIQLALLAAIAVSANYLGVNPMFGALAAGMALSRAAEKHSLNPSRSIRRIGQFLFIPLYFALVGFKLDLLRHFDATFFAGFLAFACAVKAASIYAGARMAGESRSIALNLAAALNARGGPGIVLASIALEGQIISENFFAILVLTAVFTSLFAGAWLGFATQRRDDFLWKLEAAKRLDAASPQRQHVP